MELCVYEIFESIQGESTYAGMPFVFIRLAGCNLNCAWCDTVKSQSVGNGQTMKIAKIIEKVSKFGIQFVCVTGGEPLVQAATRGLLHQLVANGMTVTLETNGSCDISGIPEEVSVILDVKCPSSGMHEQMMLENLYKLRDQDQVKFVVADKKDFGFAINIVKTRLREFKGAILMSPVLNRIPAPLLAKWVLSAKLPIRLQLQLHKILNLQ